MIISNNIEKMVYKSSSHKSPMFHKIMSHDMGRRAFRSFSHGKGLNDILKVEIDAVHSLLGESRLIGLGDKCSNNDIFNRK